MVLDELEEAGETAWEGVKWSRETFGPEPVTEEELYGDKEVDRDPLKVLPIGVAGRTVRAGGTVVRKVPTVGDDIVKGGAAVAGGTLGALGIDAYTDGSNMDMEKYLSGGYEWQEDDVQQEMEEEMGKATYSENGGGDPDDFTNDRQSVDTRPWYTQWKVKLAGWLSSVGLSGLAGWIMGKTDGNGGPIDKFSDMLKTMIGLFTVFIAVYLLGNLFNINVGDSDS